MEGQEILTLIIKNTYNDNDLTTVSFNDIDDAIDYALDYLGDLIQFEDTITYEEAREQLYDDLFLKTRDYTVWIEETKLF